MEKCPICDSGRSVSDTSCSCGYDFENKQIVDTNLKPEINVNRIRAYHSMIKSKHWSEEVSLKKRINEVQGERYGFAIGERARYKWSKEKTGKLLGQAKNTTSEDIKLAEKLELEDYTEFKNCKNKTEARTRIKEKDTGGIFSRFYKKFKKESLLRDYLKKNWHEISNFKDWELEKIEFQTGNSLRIDLLAHDPKNSKWIVIELKKDTSTDKTVGQTKAYMGWVKKNLATEDEKVEGIIISGYPPDIRMKWALNAISDITQLIYYLDGKDNLNFKNTEEAYKVAAMSEDEQLEYLRQRLSKIRKIETEYQVY